LGHKSKAGVSPEKREPKGPPRSPSPKARRILGRLSRSLRKPLGGREVGRAVAETCRQLFAYDAFFLESYQQPRLKSRSLYAEDTPTGATSPEAVVIESDLLTPLSAWLISTGEPTLINRPGDPDLAPTNSFGFSFRRSRSLMFCPVRGSDRILGLVSIQSYMPNRYLERDLELLGAVAKRCRNVLAKLGRNQPVRLKG
jgi:GAF domain-containing protein